ncbi:hypothetical protein [Brevundimonas aveniformis]|uniref:hypothetical protein n=1 Tax=Brevundimonas aveniformis TaxID=370977 RepID=UPI00248FC2AD|nr:hypothetical protein [Brevundimonas aveniformis]
MISLLLAASLMTVQPPSGINLCADPRNCRDVDQVQFRWGGRTRSVPINSSLPFVTESGIQLLVGESVVLIVSESGQLTVESHGAASDVVTPAKLSQAVEEMRADMAASGLDISGTNRPPTDDRPMDRVRLSMIQVPGGDETVLLVENGYGFRLDYAAHMQVPNQSGAPYTTTCEVMPGRMVMEHWPHPIMMINLSNFRVVEDTDAMTCD